MRDYLSKLAAQLNSVRVELDDLLMASREIHNLPPEDKDWEGRMFLMIRLFPGNPDKGSAVEHRLMAMSKLVESGVLPHWTLPQAPDGAIQIAEPVWLAATSEPLLVTEQDTYFDRESFLQRVLALATPDGNA